MPDRNSSFKNCSHEACEIEVYSPQVGSWHYLIVQSVRGPMTTLNIEAYLTISSKECLDDGLYSPPVNQCIVSNLGRHTSPARDFYVTYFKHKAGIAVNNTVEVVDYSLKIVSFIIESPSDIGGTLHMYLEMNTAKLINQSANITMCFKRDALPLKDNNMYCHPSHMITISSIDIKKQGRHLYIPYPQPGQYYLGLLSSCYTIEKIGNASIIHEERCHNPLEAGVYIKSQACIDGGCGSYGDCREYASGVYLYSACKCKIGYRGYGCGDGTNAIPDWLNRVQINILIYSNLFFLPAVALALYRQYFTEALVFTFNMVFSAFYHACDGNRPGTWCLVKYDTLSYCDYFGSITSFVATILAMTRLRDKFTTLGYMTSTFFLAFGVSYSRHALWVFLAPVIGFALLMITAWGFRCVKRSSLYPTWKRYLIMLPGFVLAATGLAIFAAAETEDNYPYTHSAWHMCMALSIIFLLPPRPKKKGMPPCHSCIESNSDSTSLNSLNITNLPVVNDFDEEMLRDHQVPFIDDRDKDDVPMIV